jgi:hypothetical protein
MLDALRAGIETFRAGGSFSSSLKWTFLTLGLPIGAVTFLSVVVVIISFPHQGFSFASLSALSLILAVLVVGSKALMPRAYKDSAETYVVDVHELPLHEPKTVGMSIKTALDFCPSWS